MLKVLLFIGLGLLPGFSAFSCMEKADSTSGRKRSLGIYPAVGYAPETKLKLGIVAMYVIPNDSVTRFNRPNSFIPYLLVTGNKQLLTSFKSEIYFANNTYWRNEMRFHHYPDFYFGTGADARKEDEELFNNRFFRNEGQYLFIYESKVFYGLCYDFRYDHLAGFEAGRMLAGGQVTGSDGGWTNGLGPVAAFDNRNDVYYPSAGSLLSVSTVWFTKALGSNYQFGNITIDARHFLTVLSPTNILALQGYFNAVVGGSLPFYRLPRLGGEDRLRGIANENLYRDKVTWYFQAEGRQHLFWRLGGTLFVGAGNVAPTLQQMEAGRTKAIAGFGGRFQAIKNQQLNIRLDAGFATDGHYAIYLALREAF